MASSQYCLKNIMRVGWPSVKGQTGVLGSLVVLRGGAWVREGWSIGEAYVLWKAVVRRKRWRERRTFAGDIVRERVLRMGGG